MWRPLVVWLGSCNWTVGSTGSKKPFNSYFVPKPFILFSFFCKGLPQITPFLTPLECNSTAWSCSFTDIFDKPYLNIPRLLQWTRSSTETSAVWTCSRPSSTSTSRSNGSTSPKTQLYRSAGALSRWSSSTSEHITEIMTSLHQVTFKCLESTQQPPRRSQQDNNPIMFSSTVSQEFNTKPTYTSLTNQRFTKVTELDEPRASPKGWPYNHHYRY